MKPIGVFDSGVGGLTVVSALRRSLPSESIFFLGDTARLPYGTKSADTVTRYSQRNIDFLAGHGVKAIVVACNTASALALPDLESPVPLWGVVEPGAARAAKLARHTVGVLATEATVLSDAYPRAIRRHRPDLEVLSQACPLFVPLVEEGWVDDSITRAVALRYVEPLMASEVDTIVLGCTHYPLLAPLLADILGDEVRLVDSAEVTAEQVRHELEDRVEEHGSETRHRFFVTDSAQRFSTIANRILGSGSSGPAGPETLEHIDL